MARIVALSSFVARGHVGLRAMVPALEAYGHDVIALPTVVLSSHAAYPHVAGMPTASEVLDAMVDALQGNGWLATTDIVITGYLPSEDHVSFAEGLVRRIRALNPDACYVCDPVLGDAPKGLYIHPATALRIRDGLVPLANLVTPNAFELSWLTDRPVSDMDQAITAARSLARPMVLATSIPIHDDRLATLLQNASGTVFTSVPQRAQVPSGTGDLLTGLFTAALAAGLDPHAALARSGALLEAALVAAGCSDDLRLPVLDRSLQEISPLNVENAA